MTGRRPAPITHHPRSTAIMAKKITTPDPFVFEPSSEPQFARRGGQDVDLVLHGHALVLDTERHVLRVVVHIDTSYAFQSRAHVDRWDGNEWRQVAYLLGEVASATWAKGGGTRRDTPTADAGARAVADRLLRLAAEVLS